MIVLVGPPGCGAEELLAELAGRGYRCLSSDDLTKERLGMAIGEAVITGQPIADAAAAAAREALGSTAQVVLLGSGALGDREGDERGLPVRERLEEALEAGALKVWLDASSKVLMNRAGLDAPRSVAIGSPRAAYLTMYQRRTPLYEHRAHRIDTSDSNWADLADQVLAVAGQGWD